MVVLETFALSSTYATVAGLHLYGEYQNLLRGKPIKAQTAGKEPDVICKVETDTAKYIALLSSKTEFEPPMYVNSPGQYGGISVPIGGGLSVEEEFVYRTISALDDGPTKEWRVMDFETPYMSHFKPDPDAVCSAKYMNTLSQLLAYLDEHKIENTQFPIRLPMKILEVKPGKGKPTYFANNYRIAGSNLNAVAYATAVCRNRIAHKGLRAAVYMTVLCGTYIAGDWQNQSYKLANYLRSTTN